MKKRTFLTAVFLLMTGSGWAASKDDPVLFTVVLDQFEYRNGEEENFWVWEADAWVGQDLNKIWVKTEGEYAESETEAAEAQLLYSRAITTYWDLQLGWRHESRPEPSRDWAVLAFKGLAPYFFEVDASFFFGEDGRTALRFEAEYELLFTQRWILSPEIEFNAFGKEDPDRGVGSGLSDMELGLRLRYLIRREFAPYIGVNWEKTFGDTADFAREEGGSSSDVQFVAGIRAWF